MLNLWLDTDIGDDIDDAVALWVAARRRGLRLVGVSTVYGPVVARAWLATELLGRLGCKAPVIPGASRPLRGSPPATEPRSYLRLVPPDIFASSPGDDSAMTSLIAQAMLAAPDPFHLVTIGALTNAARLVRDHPQAANRWLSVTCMAGRLGGQVEHNVGCDPEAADVLFRRTAPRLVGLEACSETLPRPEVESLLSPANPAGGFLLRCYEAYRGERQQAPLTLFDPITVLSLVRPDAFEFRPLRLLVEPDGQLRLSDEGAEVSYATSSDWRRLKLWLTGLLGQRKQALTYEGDAESANVS